MADLAARGHLAGTSRTDMMAKELTAHRPAHHPPGEPCSTGSKNACLRRPATSIILGQNNMLNGVCSAGSACTAPMKKLKRSLHHEAVAWTGRRALAAGFTLLEVVVVIALMALIMLALGSALRTFGATDQRLQQRKERAEDVRLWGQFLRQTLGQVVMPPPTVAPLEPVNTVRASGKASSPTGTASQPLFDAKPQSLRWIGLMPANFGTHGKHAFLLSTRPSPDGTRELVLWFMPWNGSATFPDMNGAAYRTIATQVQDFKLAYGDERPSQPLWSDVWDDPSRLPSRTKIELVTQTQTWPMLVVRMRPLAGSSRTGGFTIGGG